MASPFDVQRYVHGIKWPATKADVIAYAQEKGATESVLALLEQLPDKKFTSEVGISQSLGAAGTWAAGQGPKRRLRTTGG